MTNPFPFSIATGSTEPIHRQLVEQFRRRIASGQLQAGTEIPSVRELAQALAVNPMTVSKAFSQMQMEGLVERRRGVSMVVAAQHQRPQTDHERLALLRPALERVADEARQLGLAPTQVLECLENILKESTE